MLGAILPAVAGAVVSGLFEERANEKREDLAQNQMAFQERMSSTAYQRAVEDMQKAGLNPMLAYSQGGASAPMGAMPEVKNVASSGMASAAQAMQIQKEKEQLEQVRANTELTKAQAEKVRAETMPQEMLRLRLEEMIGSIRQGTRLGGAREETERSEADRRKAAAALAHLNLDKDTMTFSADVAARKAASELTQLLVPRAKAESKVWETDLGELTPLLRLVMSLLSQGGSAAHILRSVR